MRAATNASSNAVDVASETLQTSASNFDRAQKQTISQTLASIRASNAAKSAADTAKQTLRISERAYITVGTPQFEFSAADVILSIPNSGHIPSGKAAIIVHEQTADVTDPTLIAGTLVPVVEKHWQDGTLGDVPPGLPFQVRVYIPKAVAEQLNTGHQVVFVAGAISYNDGFSEDKKQTWEFCWQSAFMVGSKQIVWAICDPSMYIPKMARDDGYPSKEHQMK